MTENKHVKFSKDEIQAGSIKAWLASLRIQTLTASWVPVAVGSACAMLAGQFVWFLALACLLTAFFLQIGTNLANDVYDHERGADNETRLGPTRVVQSGLLSGRAVKRAMLASFAMAFVIGLFISWHAGWEIFVVGLVSILAAYAYTGGPFPLAYHGLGDVFVMLFFGFVGVCGTAYVQCGFIPTLAWWASVPVGALATCILVVNNYRDRATDEAAHKRTLIVKFGPRFAFFEFRLLLVLSFACPVVLFFLYDLPPWVFLVMLTLPWAMSLDTSLKKRAGASLNPVLASTAKLLFAFGTLFALAFVLTSLQMKVL